MNARIDALFAPWARRSSRGCAVAVSRAGDVIHSRGYGMADLELDAAITPATVFHVASLSKQITGFLVLLLADEGRLDLDEAITTYISDVVPNFGTPITLRHLLHHTSGLRDHFTMMKLSGVRPMDEKSESDIFDLLHDQRALNFPPGTDFNYCNTGWVLLAAAVRKVSGVSFKQCVEERIFAPLEMTSSSVRETHTALIEGRARAYDSSGETLTYWVPNFSFAGSTSVYTTAQDLLRWAGNILHPRVGDADLVDRFLTPGTLADGRSVRYGAGIEVGVYRGLDVVKHRGWDLGYSAYLGIYRGEGVAVAITGNVSTLPTEALGRRIADIVLAGRFREPRPRPITVPEAALRAKTGLYRHPRTDRAFWITLAGGGLRFASEPGAAGVPLRPLEPTRFQTETEAHEFILDGETLTIREESGVDQTYERARPWTPSARTLLQFEGTYRSAELAENLVFRVVDGRLVGRRRRWPARAVSPAYRDSFTDDIATYRFVRNRRRAVVGVELALDRIYHLRYDRLTARRR